MTTDNRGMDWIEEVNYDGKPCIAEVCVGVSEEPGSWMSDQIWVDALRRCHVDQPATRVCRFVGSIPVPASGGSFIRLRCRCNPSRLGSATQPDVPIKPDVKNLICLEICSYQVTQANTPVKIGVGQCPTCREVWWGLVLEHKAKMPKWATTTKVQNKTFLVNGPPRPLL